MSISRLIIHHFRNIEHADLSFSPHFNFIIGANGSGKTSLLEAIYMLGHGRAFRHLQANRIIQHEHSELILHGKLTNAQTIGLAKNRRGDNRLKIDGDEKAKLAELAKQLPIQLITPEGFELLTGGPKYRRAFIDWGCFHHYPEFMGLWNALKRILKQRNALLRQVNHYDQLKAWDKALLPLAKRISQLRADYSQHIFPEIISTCHDFLPEFELVCQFYQGWDENSDYDEVLVTQFARDKLFSYTTLGPHKADLRLKAHNTPVEFYFSRGQLKLLMCALRLAQGEYYTHLTGQTCLYLIDDFASELDQDKRALLAARLKATHAQVFISALNQTQITPMIDENDEIFQVKSGIISN